MSAPPDLRTALDAMAGEASPLDGSAADEMIMRGRSRRRRHVMTGVAVAACAAIALPLAVRWLDVDHSANEPAGAAVTGVSYDPTVDVPWPVLRDLPITLDEPLAITYKLASESGAELYRAVSASGRQWRLPHSGLSMVPTISPDGWHIAWQDTDDPALIVRDLRGGREFRFDFGSLPPQRVLALQTTMPWSPDGRYLALNLESSRDGSSVVMIDIADGSERYLPGDPAAVLGWQDADTMVGIPLFPGAAPEEPTAQVIAIELDGQQTTLSTTWAEGLSWNATVVSPDGTRLAGEDMTSSSSGAAAVLELADGSSHSSNCASPCSGGPFPTQWVSSSELMLRAPRESNSAWQVVALDVDTGQVRTLFTFSPRLPEVWNISVATGVMASGARGTPHVSSSWPGWYLDWITYGLLALALLVALVAGVRRKTRQKYVAEALVEVRGRAAPEPRNHR